MVIKRMISLLKKGEYKFVMDGIKKRMDSEILAIGLKRDLTDDFESPNALIDLNIRVAKDSDHLYFLEENTNFGLAEKNIKNCYVAIDKDDNPCYRIWLMEASQNEKIMDFFDGNFPLLNNNEALLEGSYALSTHRGNQIMPAAISRISKKGIDIGARYVLIFVDIKNIPSLKGCRRAGFFPYRLRREKWCFFRKEVSFMDIPPELLETYHSITQS